MFSRSCPVDAFLFPTTMCWCVSTFAKVKAEIANAKRCKPDVEDMDPVFTGLGEAGLAKYEYGTMVRNHQSRNDESHSKTQAIWD